MLDWPSDPHALDTEQRRLAALTPAPWSPAAGRLRVAGVFVVFERGLRGRGRAGDPGWVGVAMTEPLDGRVLERIVLPVSAGWPYDPGRLALREGRALGDALARLAVAPDVVLVDATGRDHPRGAGLALHLGAVAEVPTVGVTHRPLVAQGAWPPEEQGATAPLVIGDRVVGAWLRAVATARPLAVHEAWRTTPATAVDVVRRSLTGVRTPGPLREARHLARVARGAVSNRCAAAT
jgi:deoxyribonuclease V